LVQRILLIEEGVAKKAKGLPHFYYIMPKCVGDCSHYYTIYRQNRAIDLYTGSYQVVNKIISGCADRKA
jgi:hypothetical protein